MNALARNITADKAGFCEHLAGLAAEHQAAIGTARTAAIRNREAGITQGLNIARLAVQDWEIIREEDKKANATIEELAVAGTEETTVSFVAQQRVSRYGGIMRPWTDITPEPTIVMARVAIARNRAQWLQLAAPEKVEYRIMRRESTVAEIAEDS
jgi:hypothetical protein